MNYCSLTPWDKWLAVSSLPITLSTISYHGLALHKTYQINHDNDGCVTFCITVFYVCYFDSPWINDYTSSLILSILPSSLQICRIYFISISPPRFLWFHNYTFWYFIFFTTKSSYFAQTFWIIMEYIIPATNSNSV